MAQVLRVMRAQEFPHHQAKAVVAHRAVVGARSRDALGLLLAAAMLAQSQVTRLQRARAAQPACQVQRALQIEAHVIFVGVADGAVQLHGLAA
ncbi:hypothetical protein D3C87_1342040 [compost metagenome]